MVVIVEEGELGPVTARSAIARPCPTQDPKASRQAELVAHHPKAATPVDRLGKRISGRAVPIREVRPDLEPLYDVLAEATAR